MTTEEAIKVIEHAPDYPDSVVKQAVREGLEGKHGEFVLQLIYQLVFFGIEVEMEDGNGAS